MEQSGKEPSQVSDLGGQKFVARLHGVRYQVKDVSRAAEFCTTHLHFELERQGRDQHETAARQNAGSLHALSDERPP